jgi:hypothetical protein
MSSERKQSRLCCINALLICAVAGLTVLAFSGCGTRGDPRPPAEEHVRKSGDKATEGTSRAGSTGEGAVAGENEVPEMPDAPEGVTALYTGSGIVVTWNEVTGAVKYRIYRSAGDAFELVAETVTPAFTDIKVQNGMRYLYRVTAVGHEEGPASGEIMVITGDR